MQAPRETGNPDAGSSLARQLAQSALALLFPTSCALCGGELTESLAGGICGGCWRALHPWRGALCSRCGLPLATGLSADFLCAECRLEKPHFDLARSYGIYAGGLRAAILELKFHRREHLGARLGQLLMEPWLELQAAFGLAGQWLVLPVPLHRSRERDRGYNQAGLLARGFVRAIQEGAAPAGFRFEGRAVTRKRSTAPQSGLSLHGRRENVSGVFAVAVPDRIRDRDLILVDDVMTTGATASACAAALKRGGARRVVVLTLARATPQFPDAVARSRR